MYFNTNNETGEQLKRSQVKAGTQNAKVLGYFQINPNSDNITPEMVLAYLKLIDPTYRNTPLASIRRAFTTLASLGHIEQTGDMVMGGYGKRVHTWRLVK